MVYGLAITPQVSSTLADGRRLQLESTERDVIASLIKDRLQSKPFMAIYYASTSMFSTRRRNDPGL